MTTSLEISLALPGVVSRLFLFYWKLCLSKSLPTLTPNKPMIKSHEAITCPSSEILEFLFFVFLNSFAIQEDTRLHANT